MVALSLWDIVPTEEQLVLTVAFLKGAKNTVLSAGLKTTNGEGADQVSHSVV